MSPTLEQYQKSVAEWSKEHLNIRYSVKFWGLGEMNDGKGMWNYYLLLSEQMFLPEDYSKLICQKEIIRGEFPYERYKDENFPDLLFNGGLTFYDITSHYDRSMRGIFRTIKVGCAYGHIWNRDQGYPYNLDWITRDAQRSIEKLAELFPNRNLRSTWSGRWAPKEGFTITKAGPVHKDDTGIPEGWTNYREPA